MVFCVGAKKFMLKKFKCFSIPYRKKMLVSYEGVELELRTSGSACSTCVTLVALKYRIIGPRTGIVGSHYRGHWALQAQTGKRVQN